MANRFELNRAGVRELLLSDEMEKVLDGYASQAMSRLGSGYETDSRKGKNRITTQITAVTYEAKKENSENNSILKAVRG